MSTNSKFEVKLPGDREPIAKGAMIEHKEHGPMVVDQIVVGTHHKTVQLQSELSDIGLKLTDDQLREQWGKQLAADPAELWDGEVRLAAEGITTDDAAITVDITTEGKPEQDAEMVHLYAKDAAVRALRALDSGCIPAEVEGPIQFDWEQFYDRDEEHGGQR